jgi:hypothetical protein
LWRENKEVLEQEKELRKVSGPPVAALVIASAVLLTAGTVGFFWWQSRTPEQTPELTEEARQYLAQLDLSGVEMKAEDSFLEHTVVAIEGKITNNGERTVALVEVDCVFRDPYGVEIDRQRAVIVGRKAGPLHAGETQPFRLAFDAVPPEWNQTLPSLFISQLKLE